VHAPRSSVERDLLLSLFAAQAAIVALSPVLAEVAADLDVSTATAGQLLRAGSVPESSALPPGPTC
jgi:predicted MFS family arabinose efflux permease